MGERLKKGQGKDADLDPGGQKTSSTAPLQDPFQYPPALESSASNAYQPLAALGNSSTSVGKTSRSTEKGPIKEGRLLKEAAELLKRKQAARNYRDSKAVPSSQLCSLRERIHTVQDRNALNEGTQPKELSHTLGDIYSELGDYDKAKAILYAACPDVPNKHGIFASADFEAHLDNVLHYLEFCAWTGRQKMRAKLNAKTLSWLRSEFIQTDTRKLSVQLHLIRVLNEEGAGDEALLNLWVLEHTISSGRLNTGYLTQRAICAYQQNGIAESEHWFVRSLVLSTLEYGLYHRSTLDTLFHCGRTLKLSEKQEAAASLLEICFQGFLHTFGSLHPLIARAFQELKLCKGADTQIQNIRRLKRSNYPKGRLQSLAFEYCHLVTIADVLELGLSMNYAMIGTFVDELMDRPSINRNTAQRPQAQSAYK